MLATDKFFVISLRGPFSKVWNTKDAPDVPRELGRMATIHHQVSINAPVAAVYEAIASPDHIGTWWEKQTVVRTDRGLVLEHNPGPEHGAVKLRVAQLIPNQRVMWECISRHPTTSPASAWTGTHFIFALAEGAGQTTTVDFQQAGYDQRSTYFESNKAAWGAVMTRLKHVLESSRAAR